MFRFCVAGVAMLVAGMFFGQEAMAGCNVGGSVAVAGFGGFNAVAVQHTAFAPQAFAFSQVAHPQVFVQQQFVPVVAPAHVSVFAEPRAFVGSRAFAQARGGGASVAFSSGATSVAVTGGEDVRFRSRTNRRGVTRVSFRSR